MGRCPFYKVCDYAKNPGICEDSNQLLLCKRHNAWKKERAIRKRAKQIFDLNHKKKIRL